MISLLLGVEAIAYEKIVLLTKMEERIWLYSCSGFIREESED